MTLDDLKTNLLLAEMELHKQHGFTRENPAVAAAMARHAGASVLPLQVFAEWLARNPEAVAVLKAILEPKTVGEWTVTATMTAADDAAKSSEPHPLDVLRERAEAADQKRPGVRGATAASVVVDLGSAAAGLRNVSKIRTREVIPADVSSLGDGVRIRGAEPVTGFNGKTLTARAKLNPSTMRLVEFLDKRGPVILARFAADPGKGTVTNLPIEFVDPARREEVLSVLGKLPGANVETSFSPFENMRDPWLGGTIGGAPAEEPKGDDTPVVAGGLTPPHLVNPDMPLEPPADTPTLSESPEYVARDHS